MFSYRLGHEKHSTAILPLGLIQEEQLSVTAERMSFPRLNKSFPQDIMSFPRLNKSFPQDNYVEAQDIKLRERLKNKICMFLPGFRRILHFLCVYLHVFIDILFKQCL